ncbi:hypothetical protein TYRP_011411 [Tyrophagus putrescentiae]|nr:hypothetical protein TYRP_011411 [Tyrophagus putrescentiae]
MSSPPQPSSLSTVMLQDLPELSLLSLFHSLPLHYLLHIDEVCSDWGRLKTDALRQRKELIIVNDEIHLEQLEWPDNGLFWSAFDRHLVKVTNEEYGSPYIKLKTGLDQHALVATSITPVMCDQITTLMPKLKVLRILKFFGTLRELEQINRLLAFYRDQLPMADKKQAPPPAKGQKAAAPPAAPPKKAAKKKWALSEEGKVIEKVIKELVEKDIEAQNNAPVAEVNAFLAKLTKEVDPSVEFGDPSKEPVEESKPKAKKKAEEPKEAAEKKEKEKEEEKEKAKSQKTSKPAANPKAKPKE